MFEIEIEYLKETSEIECKAAQGQTGKGAVPKDFWESYSAMANTEGGSIFLGVEEKKGVFKRVGIAEPEQVLKEIVDTANNEQKISVNLLRNDDLIIHEENGVNLIEVRVRRATRLERPVFLKKSPLTQSFRRLHEADQKVPEPIVRRMLADQQYDTLDSRVLRNFGLDDLNAESLQNYRQTVARTNPEKNFNELSDTEFLRRMGAWGKERDQGYEGLTVAGLLMFGQYHTILDEFPDYFLDYQERAEGEGQPRYLDRITSDATWSGNLYDFYWKVYPKLVADLKVGFQLKDGIRDDESPAHIAVREALVNTLVHADYALSSPILILKSAQYFIFHNPGTMRVPLDVALQGGESDSRNKKVQDMFRLIGIGERQGFGIHNIVEGWRQFDWRQPNFIEEHDPKPRVVVVLRMLSLFPPEAVETLSQQLPDDWPLFSEAEKLALVIAYSERAVTHARLSEVTNEHPRDLSAILNGLVSQGFLMATGQSRGKTYHLAGQTMPRPDEVFGRLPNLDEGLANLGWSLQNSDGSLANLDETEEFLGLRLANLDDRLPNNEDDLPNLDELGRVLHPEFSHPLISDLRHLHSSYRQELEEVAAEPRQKKKVPRECLNQVLESLCRDQFVTATALADLVARDPATLRGQYLTPLKNTGVLGLAFPQTPTDPQQAYITLS